MPKRKPPTAQDIAVEHTRLSRWLGIEVEQMGAWKADLCDVELVQCNAMAHALKAKVAAGDRRALKILRQVEQRIANLQRARKFWASI